MPSRRAGESDRELGRARSLPHLRLGCEMSRRGHENHEREVNRQDVHVDMGESEDPDRRGEVEAEPSEVRAVRFEQYKLAAEMADRISARRGTANAFYFTISSALLATSESLSLSL